MSFSTCKLDCFIKKYIIGHTFALGTVSIVKFAKSVRTPVFPIEHEFALKITNRCKLPPDYPVELEVSILRLLNHKNIVRLCDYYITQTNLYVVMEYLPGRNLYYYIEYGFKFARDEVAKIIHDLVSGLAYLHGFHIIHRDINPRNLVLEVDDYLRVKTIKIIDFGSATFVYKSPLVHEGTIQFYAPEVRYSTPYGTNVDIWSAGVVFFYLIFGLDIFDYDFVHHELDFKFPHHITPDWFKKSPLLHALLRGMLDKNKLTRFSAEKVLGDIWMRIYNL